MFPLHTGDELFFSVSSNPHHQYKIPEDLILDHASLNGSDITHNMGKSRRRKLGAMDTHHEITSGNSNNNKKKMMHRDIERQRRQEMATLHSSLRSLLPLEFIKGKRSISDQMNEAVNYIKHLQKRIKQISDKRDELKILSKTSTLASGAESSDHNTSPPQVIVRPCLVGVEIVYSCGWRDRALPLSRVLKILLDEGLCVVNCISTRVNEQLLHTIQTEVNDPSCFNLPALQQKLTQEK